MRIHIHTNHDHVTQDELEQMKEKLMKLEHYYENIIDAIMYLHKESDYKQVEVKLNVKDKEIFVKERGETYPAALDVCMDSLKILLKKYKEKHGVS